MQKDIDHVKRYAIHLHHFGCIIKTTRFKTTDTKKTVGAAHYEIVISLDVASSFYLFDSFSMILNSNDILSQQKSFLSLHQ